MVVQVSSAGGVHVLALDRPAARNAMDTALLAALLDGLSDAVREAGTSVVVITGTGGAFSAGADVREGLDRQGHVRRMDLFAQVYEAVGTCPLPTIAAVHGPCIGGGAEVAAACDMRVADPTARFRFPGGALGFPVGAAKLVGLVGLGTAKDLVLTSRTIDADEAHRVGLVQRLAPAGAALELALEVAAGIAGQHQAAIRFLKRAFDRFSGLGDRIAAENDGLLALAEAGGDYAAAFDQVDHKAAWKAANAQSGAPGAPGMPPPRGPRWSWAGGAWQHR